MSSGRRASANRDYRMSTYDNASRGRAERDIAVPEDVALDTTFAALLVHLMNSAFRGK